MEKDYFQKFYPDPSLRNYIQYYTFVDIPFDQAGRMEFLVMPSSHTRMVLFFGTPSLQKMVDNRFERVDSYSVTGFCSKPHLFVPTQSLQQVMIHFTPWGLQPFLDFPLSEITDSRAHLNHIFQHDLDGLCEDLYRAMDVPCKKQAIDTFFLTQLRKIRNIDDRAKAITRYIFHTRGSLRLNHLSKELFIGERTLQRLIHNSIGVNYKFFSTLVRLEHARHLIDKHNLRLTDVALSAGYFDQAHFIHEFRSVYGESPGAYQQKQQNRVWSQIESQKAASREWGARAFDAKATN